MSNANINFALQSVCQQRQKQLMFTNPLPRYNPISPYNGTYTQQQLDMRRKAEILKYSNTSSSTKTNNLTKAQRWSQLTKGHANTQQGNYPTIVVTTQDYLGKFNNLTIAYPNTLQTFPTTQYITDEYGASTPNPDAYQIVGMTGYYTLFIINATIPNCKTAIIPTPTSACGVPGPPMYLYNDETVPLYNYARKTGTFSYDSTNAPPKKWLFNPTSDILLTNGQDTTILSLLITDQIDQTSYTYALQIPFSIYATGTNIATSLIYDPLTNPDPAPSYFPNISLGLETLQFGVNYNGKPVQFATPPSVTLNSNVVKQLPYTNGVYLVKDFVPLQFDVSFNEQIVANAPFGPVSPTDSFTAKIFTGYITVSNIVLLTAPGYVYDFYLRTNTTAIQFPTSARSESLFFNAAIQTTSYGVYANVSTINTTSDNCVVYPLTPPPTYQTLTLTGS